MPSVGACGRLAGASPELPLDLFNIPDVRDPGAGRNEPKFDDLGSSTPTAQPFVVWSGCSGIRTLARPRRVRGVTLTETLPNPTSLRPGPHRFT
jgi:hypothetical protein